MPTLVADTLEQQWLAHLEATAFQINEPTRQSIVKWLIGADPERFEEAEPAKQKILKEAITFKFRILEQRYLMVPPTRAYQTLINRLGSIMVVRQKIRTWISLSRDRQRQVAEVLQEIIQEMLNSDRYIQSQLAWIAECTTDNRLRNCLLLASVEEYALRPIRNQPLLAYRFVNYLRRQSRSGITQAPRQEMIRMISEEIYNDDADGSFSLLDGQAITDYEDEQKYEERQLLRHRVKEEFAHYLGNKVGPEAQEWLELYLQGYTQETIAEKMNIPIKQIYRLREKVGYHALRGFALKGKPELVGEWLEITLKEHSLGLTTSQWEGFWQGLTSEQQQILQGLKNSQAAEDLAQELGWKKNQVLGEWGKLYLSAQSIRSKE
ncbi:MAG: HetZ-related protein 2 [Cyanobacteria bacterium P01_H01_bin.15]